MTDRPILFSAPMVRALLDGRKTQTRRILKPQPPSGARYSGLHYASDEPTSWFFNSPHGPLKVRQRFEEGDCLWVRETLFIHGGFGTPLAFGPQIREGDDARIWSYGADEIDVDDKRRGIPAIHMPRAYSRLTLTVTDVRVQRLQEISEDDAIAEGIQGRTTSCGDGVDRFLWFGVPECGRENAPAAAYGDLWDSINNPRHLCPDDAPGSWAANPWIVALTFTVEKRNIDQVPT